ncbi:MAG: hypothetical protein OEZ43_21480 [Gammaproteobacteria bacterium]|nr:hypothetical protein [Gammaproteobacteria bacterium]
MKFRKLFIPFALLAGIGTLFLSGCTRHHSPEDKADYIVHKISKKMDLNEDQRSKLEAVKDEIMQHHAEHKAYKQQMIDDLIAEIEKPELDQNVLLGMVNHHKMTVEKVSPGVIEKLAVFHASLNDEQKKHMVEKIKIFRKHFDHDES